MIRTTSCSIRAVHRLYCSHSHNTPLAKYLLQNYSKPRSIGECKQIHAKLIVSGTISEVYLTNTLLNFYSRCGDLSHTNQLFNQIPQKNVVTWTSMITAYVHRGSFETALHFFVKMIQSGEKPNQFTLSVVIRACTALSYIELVLQIHGLIIHLGLEKDEFAGSSLVDMYFKYGGFLEDACRIFNGLFRRDAVTWNVMISGFAHVHNSIEVCRLFSEMQVIDELKPNDFTFTSLLKCCFYLREVEQIHGLVLKFGTESDVVVGSALVDLYGKCANMGSGRKVLDAMAGKDGFVWSSVISGYARNDCGEEAMVLFRDMCRKGLKPDQHTLSCVLKACVEIRGIETGMQIHTQVIKNGYHADCFVSSVLLNLYTDFNYMDEAEKVFRNISDRDLVAWNSMIMGYAVMPEGSTACIKLYREFRKTTTLKPDEATVIAILKSCQSQTDLDLGLQIHANIVKFNLRCETLVGNGIINMYSKCNVVDDARRAFNTMVHKDEATWNSIIGCYVQNGIQLEALKLCKEMLAVGVCLSCFSLPLCIIASSALAFLDLGKQFHSSIIKFGFARDVYVGSSVIDMYAKCGIIEDSVKVFHELRDPNVVIFNALISGFAQHGRALEAIEVFKDMEKMNIIPNKITFLAVLSACRHVGLVEESILIFNLMCQSYGIEPEPEHYSCLVDAFGRAGRLQEASQLLQNSIGVSAWRTLLSACRNHGNLLIGEKSARKVMELEPNDHSSYVLLSNVYSEAGRWEEAMVLRQQMANIGVQKYPGNSWLMIRDQVI
ncbi:pentatricopeptide repeat-containing protein At4g39530-like [Macadamia integrifolia]|uniref:pentatricopeptide repeat-containing protein At4g39530-like n=1 Tax=Macadamia integrifolia TaxID=60698 RepID=UPI001C4FB145|nr:pentatricopeptide repeat-containing protein At4g39530-like [Macadamia integrifolia]XP_042484692.1 pentatricopeptide repeat-containing protein At4g39530-like [Macadamia integrifolia]XP_042484693.1 pentatricopeptide repeat-containing protein At4g39530-like [Macadamia integrifolia]